MAPAEENLKLAIVLLLSAVAPAIVIYRRYGSVWRTILDRLGPRWPRVIAYASIATLALWMLFWVFVGPERRAELKQIFQNSAPWGLRGSQDRQD